MKLPVRWICTAITIAFSVLDIGCSPDDSKDQHKRLPKRCHDIADAVDYLHKYLPAQMPIQEKCKRYALISDIVKIKRLPPRKDIIHLTMLYGPSLDRRYQQLDNESLSAFYMNAIDTYRSSELRPPMLEIVECLKQIDSPPVKIYLTKPELTIILDLYKKILDSPETTIDLNNIDLSTHKSAFRSSLEFLFRANLVGSVGSQDHTTEAYATELPASDSDESKDNFPYIKFQSMTEEQLKKAQLQLRRKRERKRQRVVRKERPYRHREQERLRKQRMRILMPNVIKEKERIRQRKRADRLRADRLRQGVDSIRSMPQKRQSLRPRKSTMQQLLRQQQYLEAIRQPRQDLETIATLVESPSARGFYIPAPAADRIPFEQVNQKQLENQASMSVRHESPHLNTSRLLRQLNLHQSSPDISPRAQAPVLFDRPGSSVDPGQSEETHIEQEPLVRPMTSFPRLSHTADHYLLLRPELTPDPFAPPQKGSLDEHVSNDGLVQADQIFEDHDKFSVGSYSYDHLDTVPYGDAKDGQSPLDNTLPDTNAGKQFDDQKLEPHTNQFEDTDAVLQWFTDAPEVSKSKVGSAEISEK